MQFPNSELPWYRLPHRFWSWWKPMQSPTSWNVQIRITWKYSVENDIIPMLRVFEEIRKYWETEATPRA